MMRQNPARRVRLPPQSLKKRRAKQKRFAPYRVLRVFHTLVRFL
jgi:hypothetical protein